MVGNIPQDQCCLWEKKKKWCPYPSAFLLSILYICFSQVWISHSFSEGSGQHHRGKRGFGSSWSCSLGQYAIRQLKGRSYQFISSEESPQFVLSDTTPSTAPIYLYQCYQPTTEDNGYFLVPLILSGWEVPLLQSKLLWQVTYGIMSAGEEKDVFQKNAIQIKYKLSLFYSGCGSCPDWLRGNGIWRWGIFSSCWCWNVTWKIVSQEKP